MRSAWSKHGRTDSSIREVKYRSRLPTNSNHQASSFTMRDNAIFLVHNVNLPTVKPQRQHLSIQGLRNHNAFLRCLSAQTKAVLIQKVEWVWCWGLHMRGQQRRVWEERGQCAEHRERDEDRIEAAAAAIEGEGQWWWPKLIKERVTDHTSNIHWGQQKPICPLGIQDTIIIHFRAWQSLTFVASYLLIIAAYWVRGLTYR